MLDVIEIETSLARNREIGMENPPMTANIDQNVSTALDAEIELAKHREIGGDNQSMMTDSGDQVSTAKATPAIAGVP